MKSNDRSNKILFPLPGDQVQQTKSQEPEPDITVKVSFGSKLGTALTFIIGVAVAAIMIAKED